MALYEHPEYGLMRDDNELLQAERLMQLLREAHASDSPYEHDVAVHTGMLVSNGWPAAEALRESKRTLDEAEAEAGE